MAYLKKALKWLVTGIEPSEEKKAGGFADGEAPAPGHFDYMFKSTYDAIEELQEKSAEKDTVAIELNKKANTIDMTTALAKKVNVFEGKGLSTNDYTQAEKEKLANLQNTDVSELVTKEELTTHKSDTATHNTWVTCATASASTAKVGTASGFTLATGSTVRVKFTNDNTADTPTLNVNGTGAKALKKADGNAFTKIVANGVYSFVYDGSNFIAQGEGGGDYSVGDTISRKNLTGLSNALPLLRFTLTGHTGGVRDVKVGSDGSIYSCSEDFTLKKYNSNGTLVWSQSLNTTVLSVDVDLNDNVYVACGTDVKKYNSSGALTWTFSGHTSAVWGVFVDKDSNVYSASSDNTVKKISSSGAQIWSFSGHTSAVYNVFADNDSNVYSVSDDKTVKKISSSGSLVWTFSGHTSAVWGVFVDKDNNVYSASADKTVKKISSSGAQIWSFSGHTGTIRDVKVDSLGYVYSASDDKTVKKISSSGTLIWTSDTFTASAYAIDIDDKFNVYIACADKTVKKIIEYADEYKITGVD